MNRFLSVLLLSVFVFDIAFALSVEEAYKAIPHRQTTYRLSVSHLPTSTARGLERMFLLIDEAVALRVETLQWFRSSGRRGKSFGEYKKEIERLLARLSVIDYPEESKFAAGLIAGAIRTQRDFFSIWNSDVRSGRTTAKNLSADRKVQKASTMLRRAYNDLMKRYPTESKINKQAFFDHLCALDFI